MKTVRIKNLWLELDTMDDTDEEAIESAQIVVDKIQELLRNNFDVSCPQLYGVTDIKEQEIEVRDFSEFD